MERYGYWNRIMTGIAQDQRLPSKNPHSVDNLGASGCRT